MQNILFFILLFIGVYLIFLDIAKLPSRKADKAFQSIQYKEKKVIVNALKNISNYISKYVKINEYKRISLSADLKIANIDQTPEEYRADTIVETSLYGLIALILFFLLKPLSLIFGIIAISTYFNSVRKIQKKIAKKRSEIELELPSLVSTINQTVKHNKDLISLLENFSTTTCESFRDELEITTADMRSGNYEMALIRLERRIGSGMLSEVVNGLIALVKGENTEIYFTNLSIKFADIQKQELKMQAEKIPQKISKLSFTLTMFFIGVYFLTMIVDLVDKVKGLF